MHTNRTRKANSPTATLLKHTLLTQRFMSTSKAVPLVAGDRKIVILRGQFCATHSSVAVGVLINGEHFGLNELFFSNLTPQHLFHSDRAFHNMDMRLQRGRNCVYKRRHVLGYRDRILLKPMQLRATLLLDSRVVCSNMV